MSQRYASYIQRENEYFASVEPGMARNKPLEPQILDDGITWLCDGAKAVLDFGCGSGALSFRCGFCGVQSVLGIDLSEEAIRLAAACAGAVPQCRFQHGSLEQLRSLPDGSFDGVILSNILDNLYPDDALELLERSAGLLRPGGKAFIKLNPLLTAEQIENWNIRQIGEDLLDDGLLLWNKDDAYWLELLGRYFRQIKQEDVYFAEYDQHNRLFLCTK